MKKGIFRLTALGAVLLCWNAVLAQELPRPPQPEAQLRFDEVQSEEVADNPLPADSSALTDRIAAIPGQRFVCKLNRRRVSEAMASALMRMAGEELTLFKVPENLWHGLSHEAVYVLDGLRVPGRVFQFIDGLILRTLDVHTDAATMERYETDKGVVTGDTYPDRIPLVVFNGEISSVEIYGERGMYGAICIDLVE